MMMKKAIFLACAGVFGLSSAWADVNVVNPWVRATVVQQSATGAFMDLTSSEDAKLVGAESPVANTVEVHEMAMDGGVMRMRPVAALALPAGKTVSLKPGSYHVMLMGLKLQLDEGNEVPMTLVVEGKDGKRQKIELVVPVRALTAMPGGAMQHGPAGMH